MIYNNTEFYVQDNWKATSRLTVDYGIRFTRQQPQYDQFGQMSNFFPEQWSASQAPVLYQATLVNGVRNAYNPINKAVLTIPGLPNTQAAIGTPIPGVGQPDQRHQAAGDGIAKTSYIVAEYRVRAAFRHGVRSHRKPAHHPPGWRRDLLRPPGRQHRLLDSRQPADRQRAGPAQRSAAERRRQRRLKTIGVPGLVTFQYDAKVPASWQWQGGVQLALPWSASLDVSYVGNHGYNRLGGLQGGTTVNLNAVDIGAAYLPQNQDPTQTSTVPGENTIDNQLRTYKGLGNINQNTTDFHDTYHSIQANLNRRFRDGFAFGVNYTYSISWTGNTGLQKRLQHAPDGTISVRSDQAQYEALNNNLAILPHVFRANCGLGYSEGSAELRVHRRGHPQRLAALRGVHSESGDPYDLTYTYQNNGATKNLTGSQDYGARIVYVGDPGSGCSSNQYAQFNVARL